MEVEVNEFTHRFNMESSSSSSSVPPKWLQVLLGETFFMPCLAHVSQKKNEKNILCLECCISLCSHCLLLHPSHHHLLQVRRYVYQDVLRLCEAQKLVDCSFVQPYIANRAKVVFLKDRPMTRQFIRAGGSGNTCITCQRTLQDRFFFCSISCKVVHMVKITPKTVSTMKQYDDDDGMKWERRIVIRSCLDLDGTRRIITIPNSVTNSNINNSDSVINNELIPAPWSYHTTSFSDHCSRRKRVPHRSPLY